MDCLQAFGLQWDGEIYHQSRNTERYAEALARLAQQQSVYNCLCSRKELMAYPGVYPGFCRDLSLTGAEALAVRIKSIADDICFTDRLQNIQRENLARQHGDFIIKRRDGITAYQLAVVVDDHAQQVNQIVRGVDLLGETCKQLFLQRLLAFPAPEYMHLPIIVDQHGNKLSKQTGATAVDYRHPGPTLFLLLELLKQNPPLKLSGAEVRDIVDWGVEHWRPQLLKGLRMVSSPG